MLFPLNSKLHPELTRRIEFMPVSPLQAAKRLLVSVLVALARQYNVAIAANRDSPDNVVEKAFKKVALRAHPDKGGSNEDFQKLQAAREAWKQAGERRPECPRPWGEG